MGVGPPSGGVVTERAFGHETCSAELDVDSKLLAVYQLGDSTEILSRVAPLQ